MSYGSRGRVSRRAQRLNRTLRRIEGQTAGVGAYGLIGNRVYLDMEVFAKEAGFMFKARDKFRVLHYGQSLMLPDTNGEMIHYLSAWDSIDV